MSDLERVDSVDEIVDLMQQTRVHNNVEWMTILRIALKSDPEQTKTTIRKIAQYDHEIHDLWRRLGTSQTPTKGSATTLKQRLANLRKRYPSTSTTVAVFGVLGVWFGASTLWEPFTWIGVVMAVVGALVVSLRDDRKP